MIDLGGEQSIVQQSMLPGLGPDVSVGWIPPPPGMIKMNLDASCWGDGYVGLGVIFRNFVIHVLACASRHMVANWSSYVSKAIAMAFGL